MAEDDEWTGESDMNKWIAMIVLGGALSTLGLVGSARAPSNAAAPAPAADVEPCPTCCPPEICGYNGPSFDGTTLPATVAHSSP
jgi:hypothetical protein